MILDDAELEVYADGSDAPGWVYSIASTPSGEIITRDQEDDPVFTADYDNNPFESGTVYRVFAYHPELQRDRRLMRVVFDEYGGYKFLSPGESPDGAGGGGDSSAHLTVIEGADGQLLKLVGTSKRYAEGVPAPTLDSLVAARDFAYSPGIPYSLASGLAGFVDENGKRLIERIDWEDVAKAVVIALDEAFTTFLANKLGLTLDNLLKSPAFTESLKLRLGNVKVFAGDDNQTFRGLELIMDRVIGQIQTLLVGRFADGTTGIGNGRQARIVFEESSESILLQSPFLRANATQFIARSFSALTLAPATQQQVYPVVFEYDPVSTEYKMKVFNSRQDYKAWLGITQEGDNSDDWQVTEVCQFYETLPAPPYQILTVSGDDLYNGALIEHNMQTTALVVTYNSVPSVGVSFADADHLQLSFPEGLDPDELTLKLEPKTLN